MTHLLVLSHLLRPDSPRWPTNPPAAAVELFESIERGDPDNNALLRLCSHSGTHVDTPWHFNPDGRAAWQLPIDAFVFERARLIDVPAGEQESITRAALERHAETVASADLLLIRTGWGDQRIADPRRYETVGPVLAADAARWLIGHEGLRAIAADAISIGAPWNPEVSVEIHHVLTGLGRTDGRFVLIYEDVAMPAELDAVTIGRVFAWPLFIEGSDGSPVTIVAEVDA